MLVSESSGLHSEPVIRAQICCDLLWKFAKKKDTPSHIEMSFS